MAPRPPESRSQVLERLRRHGPGLGDRTLRFGSPHHSHAVVQQEGAWRVRRLELAAGVAEAHLRDHGRFMPEDAERLSEPTGAVVLEAPTLEELIRLLEAAPWPL